MELTTAEALTLRMTSLLLRDHPAVDRPKDVAGVVTWLGAMQAQDNASAMWSLGVRLPDLTVSGVHDSLERREALRTWPMRGTVHLVPSRDAHWMLAFTGVRALAGAAKRREYLGLSSADADRAVDLLGSALAGGKRLTRTECVRVLVDGGIPGADKLGYHLLWYSAQKSVTCIAPLIGKEQSFVLLDEWVPDPVRLEPEEALATLTLRFFRGRGPATRKDFAGWAGLTAAEVKRGIAACGDALSTVSVDGTEMVVAAALLSDVGSDDSVRALPGFDEFLLGFKDRSLMVAPEHKQAIIPGGNGVFQSTISRGGRVLATWKRVTGARRTRIDVFPLAPVSARERGAVEAAFEGYARFVEAPLEFRWP
ncbi:hypothetical protein Val02_01210 [Virgisporangium aliadipatigenens]|uniref:Winged helix DNA-binding domain-containing protein n=1 Tax=Virgisporangium aliadipatigenens TaxID=741659 RepID=A0A8J3YFQ6_9ACTN|nr:winged helix DNA-binding domain-containing protein [Virgisporangium aliadipatigenens]GIJ43235.1 hypothetical protein Val02_01210 [Virgisporangium aliadipatigenens]